MYNYRQNKTTTFVVFLFSRLAGISKLTVSVPPLDILLQVFVKYTQWGFESGQNVSQTFFQSHKFKNPYKGVSKFARLAGISPPTVAGTFPSHFALLIR